MGFNVAAGRFGQPVSPYPASNSYTVQSKPAYPAPPVRRDSPPSAKSSIGSSSGGSSSDNDSPPGSPTTSKHGSGHNFGTTVDPVFRLVPPDQGDKIQDLFDAWVVYADSKGKKGKKELRNTLAVVIQVAADALLSKHTRILDYDPGKQDGLFAFEETVDGKRRFRVFDGAEVNREVDALSHYQPTRNPFVDIPSDLFDTATDLYLKHKSKQPLVDRAIILLLPITYGKGELSSRTAIKEVGKLRQHGRNTTLLWIIRRRTFEATWRRYSNQLPIPFFDPNAKANEKAAEAERQRQADQANRSRLEAAQRMQRIQALGPMEVTGGYIVPQEQIIALVESLG